MFVLERAIKDALDYERDKGYQTRMYWTDRGNLRAEIWWRDTGESAEISIEDFIRQERQNDPQKTKGWAEQVVGVLEKALKASLEFYAIDRRKEHE